jgi:hypothetical protein
MRFHGTRALVILERASVSVTHAFRCQLGQHAQLPASGTSTQHTLVPPAAFTSALVHTAALAPPASTQMPALSAPMPVLSMASPAVDPVALSAAVDPSTLSALGSVQGLAAAAAANPLMMNPAAAAAAALQLQQLGGGSLRMASSMERDSYGGGGGNGDKSETRRQRRCVPCSISIAL